ncbi:hypothetical protein AAKU55_000508 [Oxalobacteraceae bacterium GrIS 1.11]
MNVHIKPAFAVAEAGPTAAEIGQHAAPPCANCATILAGNYCHACGQAAHVHHSLLHLGEEVLHGILHFDTKAWRTIPMLVARPGQLTRRYIDGQRSRFVSPLGLFLFMVFLMFFVLSYTSAILDSGAAGQHARLVLSDAPAAHEAADGLDINDPHWKAAVTHALKNPELTIYKLKNTAYKYSFILVPISLPFLWLMFLRRRDITLYDHAVFSLYSLAFMSLLLSALALLECMGVEKTSLWLLMTVPPAHMFVHLRGTYGLGIKAALWRTMLLLCVAGSVFLLFLLLVMALSIH